MDVQKHDEIMSFIMKKLEEEKLDVGSAIQIWHSMGLFIFSQLDTEEKDVSKIYEAIREYLTEMEKLKV
ncbi:hypothetical protein [Sulfurimonas sp.]|uniref:hypothetical protein n=1 Tax=Sulfurimonas sp. TaxID=2022749 RepID=UPI00356483D1